VRLSHLRIIPPNLFGDGLVRKEKETEMQGKSREQTFRAGELVPTTGIYLAVHGDGHSGSRDGVLVGNENFPACEICGKEVRYKLERSAPYIIEDPDFFSGASE
jgi:hypothetical protein